MVLGNMITNKSYDKRYDVPIPFPANASVAYTRAWGEKELSQA